MKFLIYLGLFLSFLSTNINASILAIVDSGVDYQHTFLSSNIWKNRIDRPGNYRDEDGNGYRDDFYGWNFAAQSPVVINYNYLDSFSGDPMKYLAIQGKSIKGSASAEELAWIKAKRSDQNFIAEMGIFGNFAHGTHVAGIASRIATESQILSVKLLPTEIREKTKQVLERSFLISKSIYERPESFKSNNTESLREKALISALEFLANQQTMLLGEVFRYLQFHQVKVMNGSFGTSFQALKGITDIAYKVVFWKNPSQEDSKKYTNILLSSMLQSLRIEVSRYPDILFVFAAGNSQSNNDEFFSSPANINLSNTISVAAAVDRGAIASFSNYGVKTVDLAAPGVGILSSYPTSGHNEFVHMSGTSQASPYVAGVAAKVRSINPGLTAAQTKEIILQTVDAKEIYRGKVKTSGIVNLERAKVAAKNSLVTNLTSAIGLAKNEVQNIQERAFYTKAYSGPLLEEFMVESSIQRLEKSLRTSGILIK